MEITYDTILKILLNEQLDNTFSNKINIMQYASDFTCFNNIFDESFYRYGIYNYDEKQNNISFLCSLLFCLDKKYFSKEKTDILHTIKNLKSNIKDYFISNYSDININNKISLEMIKSSINNKILDSIFLEIITICLKINILIFDFKDNKIKASYYSDFLNPWRTTIFLAKYENNWEPICTQETKNFSFSSPKVNILKNKILTEDIEYHDKNYKEFVINDNIHEILEIEKFINVVSLETTFTTQNNISNSITKSKLNKMRKDKILQLLNDLNLEIDVLKPTKKDLINIILSHHA